MPTSLDEKTWKILVDRIKDAKCTPFLGAGACYGLLPLGGDVARKWAAEYHYPFPDSSDLVKVSQFLALDQQDRIRPKELMLRLLAKEAKNADFRDPLQAHRAIADLELPIYLTTNYDNYMVQALKHIKKDPRRELCRWNEAVKRHPSVFDVKPPFKATPANPVVYHMHGHDEEAQSLVLIEDDYMDFLVNLSTNQKIIPPVIKSALSGTSLLFLGYKIVDWNFRVVLRSISRFREGSLKQINVAVMLPPTAGEVSGLGPDKAQSYLDSYYENIGIQVYWGTVTEFVAELRQWMGASR
jgi:hypothetical protein